MTKEIPMTNDEKAQFECRTNSMFAFGPHTGVRNSGFVIISSFVIRHSSFSSLVIRHSSFPS